MLFFMEKVYLKDSLKIEQCIDVDPIIIMGTSLKVQTFANIPHLTYPNDDIVVFNMEQVRGFFFHRLYKNAIFIQGKTDEYIIKFLKDMNMFDEFKEFMKKEYSKEFKDDNDIGKLNGDMEKMEIK